MYINESISVNDLDIIKNNFKSSGSVNYVNFSDLFDKTLLSEISGEFDGVISTLPQEKNIYGSFLKYRLSLFSEMPPKTRNFIQYLNSQEFIKFIEEITGISDLISDPDLLGGGMHAIGAGGFLKIHTDFNWHAKLNSYRRLNLLIYLNDNWDESFGGAIELWEPDLTKIIFKLPPVLGNALLFSTSDLSYHGHPDPVRCPSSAFRKSIAIYYYTKSRPSSEIKFGRSEMTNYIERPGERFNSDAIRRVRHKFIFLVKRFFYSLCKIFNL